MKVPFRYLMTAASIAAVAFAIAGGVMVHYWLGAIWGIAIFAFAMVPIFGYAAIGGLVFDPSKTSDGLVDDDAPPVEDRVQSMVLPLVLASLPFAILLGSWHSANARALVTTVGGELGVRSVAERGLNDVDPVVALAGCRAMENFDAGLSRDLIISSLFEAEDRELVSCLLGSLPSEIEGRATLRLQMLAARWDRQLWTADLPAEDACRLSDHLRQASRAGVDLATPRLLTCAIGAPDASTQQCCAQSLRAVMGGTPSVASVLPPAERTVETVGVLERAELLVASKRLANAEVAAMLGLDEPEYDAWTLDVGCASLPFWRGGAQERVGNAMARSLRPRCDVDPPNQANVGIWIQTCTEAHEVLNPAQRRAAICDGLARRFTQESVAVARSTVHRGVRTAKHPPRARTPFDAMLKMGMFGGSDQALSVISGMPGIPDLSKVKGGSVDLSRLGGMPIGGPLPFDQLDPATMEMFGDVTGQPDVMKMVEQIKRQREMQTQKENTDKATADD